MTPALWKAAQKAQDAHVQAMRDMAPYHERDRLETRHANALRACIGKPPVTIKVLLEEVPKHKIW